MGFTPLSGVMMGTRTGDIDPAVVTYVMKKTGMSAEEVLNSFNKKLQLSAEPRFSGSVLDAFGENEFDIYPLKLLIPTIRFISKKEVRMLIRGVRDAR